MTTTMTFRSYDTGDFDDCLAVFDANCPEFFAPNERADYARYLSEDPEAYEVCLRDGKIAGAYGAEIDRTAGRGRITWTLIDPAAQGGGVGSRMLRRALERFRSEGVTRVDISASQKSAPFFAHFGAKEESRIREGWGPGLDRVEMVWRLS